MLGCSPIIYPKTFQKMPEKSETFSVSDPYLRAQQELEDVLGQNRYVLNEYVKEKSTLDTPRMFLMDYGEDFLKMSQKKDMDFQN